MRVSFVLLLTGLSLSATALALVKPAAAPPTTLYGSIAPPGWGPTASTINQPGPLVVVVPGASVTLNLASADGAQHSFAIDLNGNGAPDMGETLTGPFSSGTPAPFTFTAPAAGDYTYYCGVHGFAMSGTLRSQAASSNTIPNVAFTSPAGSSRWTGGVQHPITWTMNDAEDPNSALHVWLNLTLLGTSTTLVPGQAAAASYLWNSPGANATATLHLDVQDSGGLVGSSQIAVALDTARPSITSHNIASSRAVEVTFNESMTASTSNLDFSVKDLNTSSWGQGTIAWDASATKLTLTPTSDLTSGHTYRLYVNATLKDASLPGNTLGSATTYDVIFTGTTAPTPDYSTLLLASAIAAVAVVVLIGLITWRRRHK